MNKTSLNKTAQTILIASLIISMVIFLAGINYTLAHAEEVENTNDNPSAQNTRQRPPQKQPQKINFSERRPNATTTALRKEVREERLNELAKKRIGAYVKRIVRRLEAALNRMSKLGDRIDSRITKFEEKGLDMSNAISLLAEARVEISNAQSSIEAMRVNIDAVLESDNPKESFSQIRALIGEAKDGVKKAHKALIEAIKAMKAGVVKSESDDEVENSNEQNEDEDIDEDEQNKN